MKRYQEIWTEEVFIIDAIVVYGNPTIYKIKDQDNEPIKETFYEQEHRLILEPILEDVLHQETDSKKKWRAIVYCHM